MTFTAFFLIAASATFHAGWNLIAKKNRITVPYYALVCTCCALFWCHVQFWTPVPLMKLPPKFWLFVAGSVGADVLYCVGLTQCYKRMEMATVYPIMRALPILMTAFFVALLGWGATLSPMALLGFLIVFIGALLMPLNRLSEFSFSRYWNWSMLSVLVVALGTTWYTICDSRALSVMSDALPGVSKGAMGLTYYSSRCILLALVLWIWSLLDASHREILKDLWRKKDRSPLLAGAFASLTYVLVVLAMNYVTNVSYVQVFRQIGLPLGMLLGIVVLKEHGAPVKWAGVTLILGGLAISALL